MNPLSLPALIINAYMKQFFLLGLLACTAMLSAQLNTTLRDNLDYDQAVNDIWGYVAPDGTEYAIVGTQTGTSFVSLADPDNIQEVAFIPGDNSVWRDIKTFGEYAYTTADQGNQGITAFDLSDLPNNVTFKRNTYQIPGFGPTFDNAHNLYIDTNNGRLYTAGGTRQINDGGILIFDLNTDPMTPEFVAAAPETYSHDVYVKADTLYCSEIYDGELAMYDISDLDNIKTLGTTLTPFTFTHNAWTTDNSKFIFTTDERGNAPVAAYDISDKEDIQKTFEFRPLGSLNTGTIPHNVHVIEDYLSISYYTDGLVVADASKPDNIIEVANYDTWPGPNGDFNGCWGAYPFLPSGLTLATDRQTGLYVLDVDYKRAARLEGTITDLQTTQPINDVLVEIDADQLNSVSSNAQGVYKTGLAEGGTYNVSILAENYMPLSVEKDLVNGDCLLFDTTMTKSPVYDLNITVVDDETGAPIPAAKFEFRNHFRDISMVTDQNGKVTFSTPYDGDFELVITEWGYLTMLETNIDPSNLIGQVIRLTPGYMDDFITDEGWTISGDASTGEWERAIPVGTIFNEEFMNPGLDASGDLGEECYVTGNMGGDPRNGDIDDGFTTITSPEFGPLGLADLKVSYQYWFANAGADPINDTLTISITNGTETSIVKKYAFDGNARWIADSFRIDEFVEVNDALQLIVTASDPIGTQGHLVEAGFDNFLVYGRTIPVGTDNHFANLLQAKVFPNPSQEAFNLQYEGRTLTNPSIRVTDAIGRMISQQTFSGESVTFGAELPSGLYFAELYDGASRVYVTKLIKK